MKANIEKYKEKKNILNQEKRAIYLKIERLKKRIRKRDAKIEKLDKKLLIKCNHEWIPDLINYNVYDRPKICKYCNLTKY